LNSVLCCLIQHAMRTLYKTLQDAIRCAIVSGPCLVSRASIAYENILWISQVCLRSTLAGHFQSTRMKKMRISPLVTHYFQVNQCEDNNTLQLNQPHKQYNRAPIYITAETQRPHKSDYGRRLIEVPSSIRCSMCTVTDNYCRLNYNIYDLRYSRPLWYLLKFSNLPSTVIDIGHAAIVTVHRLCPHARQHHTPLATPNRLPTNHSWTLWTCGCASSRWEDGRLTDC